MKGNISINYLGDSIIGWGFVVGVNGVCDSIIGCGFAVGDAANGVKIKKD